MPFIKFGAQYLFLWSSPFRKIYSGSCAGATPQHEILYVGFFSSESIVKSYRCACARQEEEEEQWKKANEDRRSHGQM